MIETLIERLHDMFIHVYFVLKLEVIAWKIEGMITLTRAPRCRLNWGVYTAICHATSKSAKTALLNDLFDTHAYQTERLFSVQIDVPLHL